MKISDFWKDTIERAVKTFAQAELATVFVEKVTVLDVSGQQVLAVGGTAVVVSLLTSLLSFSFGRKGTASATDAVVTSTYADAVASGRHAAGLADGPA